MNRQIYLDHALAALPRVLSALNRTKGMESFGCFDRNWWHYKITDFPSARMQEGVLTLAILWKGEWSPYRSDEKIFECINAAIDFWISRQHRGGSVEEWYPGERSFVATAFSLYAVSETLLLIPELKNRQILTAHIRRSADWLLGRREETVTNQNSGALAALYNAFLLTGDERYRQASKNLARFIASRQSSEGWFPEYGGPDIGYLSLTIDYLAKYYLKSKDDEVKPMLEKALEFISHFIHPDGSAGGIYASRNTAYLIPSGFEALASEFPIAAAIAKKVRVGYQTNALPTPETLDDRYLLQNGYTFLQAHMTGLAREESNVPELPCETERTFQFPQAGILVHSDSKVYFVVNTKKGGVFYLYDKEIGKGESRGGLVLRRAKKVYVSGSLQTRSGLTNDAPLTFLIQGSLVREKETKVSGTFFFLLRAAHVVFSFLPNGEQFLKVFLRRVLILNRRESRWKFSRKFIYQNGKLEVADYFPPHIFDKGYAGGYEEFVYVPSSRLFLGSQLNSDTRDISSADLKIGKVRVF
ncbi:MAG: terpene cyclase/mutase family protein [Candidatus Sungbacteria bacterium]|nr:terpene cyclase/mutase family protein [Candidatus Sungbacteria bacterium]